MASAYFACVCRPARYPHAVLIRPLIVGGVWMLVITAISLAATRDGWWALPGVILLAVAALGT